MDSKTELSVLLDSTKLIDIRFHPSSNLKDSMNLRLASANMASDVTLV